MALNLIHNTPAQIAARFWARLQAQRQLAVAGDEAARIKFSRMIWQLYGHVQAGDFTSNDVRLSFNAAYGRSLTLAQWNSFVTNTLAPIRDRYQAMIDQGDL